MVNVYVLSKYFVNDGHDPIMVSTDYLAVKELFDKYLKDLKVGCGLHIAQYKLDEEYSVDNQPKFINWVVKNPDVEGRLNDIQS